MFVNTNRWRFRSCFEDVTKPRCCCFFLRLSLRLSQRPKRGKKDEKKTIQTTQDSDRRERQESAFLRSPSSFCPSSNEPHCGSTHGETSIWLTEHTEKRLKKGGWEMKKRPGDRGAGWRAARGEAQQSFSTSSSFLRLPPRFAKGC